MSLNNRVERCFKSCIVNRALMKSNASQIVQNSVRIAKLSLPYPDLWMCQVEKKPILSGTHRSLTWWLGIFSMLRPWLDIPSGSRILYGKRRAADCQFVPFFSRKAVLEY